MGWKNWSYWLKGGVITFSADFIIVLLIIFTSHKSESIGWGLIFTQIPFSFTLLGFFSKILCYPVSINTASACEIPLAIIGGLISWFIIGALIGWIYGKIKNRNQS